MRIRLDKDLDWRLRRNLPGHQVESVLLLGGREFRTETC
jgi:hypothetical protein